MDQYRTSTCITNNQVPENNILFTEKKEEESQLLRLSLFLLASGEGQALGVTYPYINFLVDDVVKVHVNHFGGAIYQRSVCVYICLCVRARADIGSVICSRRGTAKVTQMQPTAAHENVFYLHKKMDKFNIITATYISGREKEILVTLRSLWAIGGYWLCMCKTASHMVLKIDIISASLNLFERIVFEMTTK